MGLGIYFKDSDGNWSQATTGIDKTNPITTVHDGKNGDTKTTVLYLRNDDSTKWFSNITITPFDRIDANPYGDVGYDETGWGVKLNKGGTEPTQGEWNDIDWAENISMDNVGSNSAADVATYYPFWYLITCPPNENAKNKSDIVLKIQYTENAVTV